MNNVVAVDFKKGVVQRGIVKPALKRVRLGDLDPRSPDERRQMRALMENRERRALEAYWGEPGTPHPPEEVQHFEHDGLEFVMLYAEVTGPLAIFRVRNDNRLKRLKKVPDFRVGHHRGFPSLEELVNEEA
jgi:hypothetical protein